MAGRLGRRGREAVDSRWTAERAPRGCRQPVNERWEAVDSRWSAERVSKGCRQPVGGAVGGAVGGCAVTTVRRMTGDPRVAIERLLYDYCFGIDSGDFASTAELFGDGGLYGLVGSDQAARGSSQVLGMLRASVRTYDGVPRTRHLVTNVSIDLADDERSATVRSSVQVVHQPGPGEPIRPIVVGTYLDRVVLTDDTAGLAAWRFAERRMHLEFTGDLSTHLQAGFL